MMTAIGVLIIWTLVGVPIALVIGRAGREQVQAATPELELTHK